MAVRFTPRLIATVLLVLAVSSAGPADASAAETLYSVEDIGTLVGTGDGQFDGLTNVMPVEVNLHGDIVSNSLPADGSFWSVPFTNIEGKVRRLGRERAFSYALDMNDSGEIAGYVTTLDDVNYQQRQAVVWRDRIAIALPGLGGASSGAFGINERGEIVGDAVTEIGETHAVRWRNDEIEDLGTLGGANSFASDLNDEGSIVGQSNVAERDGLYPCLWEDGEAIELPLPEGQRGYASAINASGDIVGIALGSSNALHAVRWIDREPEILPTFVEAGLSIAYDINGDGVAVGWSAKYSEGQIEYRAALWDGDLLVDLNERLVSDLGYVLDTALAINEAGQILASGTDADGVHHGVALSPIDPVAGSGVQSNQKFAVLFPKEIRQGKIESSEGVFWGFQSSRS